MMAVNRRLWLGVLGTMALALIGALALIVALALGWNSPRPPRPPDWHPTGLPRDLEAPSGEMVVSLLGHPGGDFTFATFALETTATSLASSRLDFNGYGLVYRAQDRTNYYTFAVGSDGYYTVMRVKNGESTPLVDWQQFPHVRRGPGPNRLRLTCAGPTCHFYINDEYATTVEDDNWLDGDIGLWVWGAGEQPTSVRFEDIHVWNLE